MSRRSSRILASAALATLVATSVTAAGDAQDGSSDVDLEVQVVTLARQGDGSFKWTASEVTTVAGMSLPDEQLQPGQPQYGDITFLPDEQLQPGQPQYVPGQSFGLDELGAGFPATCAGSDYAAVLLSRATDPASGELVASWAEGLCFEADGGPRQTEPEATAVTPEPEIAGNGSDSQTQPETVTGRPEIAPGLPRPGRWSNDSTKGKIVCAGRTIKVPARKGEIGRISLTSDGTGFVLRDADGSNPTRLKPHKRRDGVFVGTARRSEGRFSIRLDYTMTVVSSEKITGSMKGKATAGGQSCRFSESYKATFVGD